MTMSRKKLSKVVKVRTYISKHPDASAKDVASATGVSTTYVYNIMSAKRKKDLVDKAVEVQNAAVNVTMIPLVGVSKEIITGATGNTYQFTDYTPKPPQVGFFQSLGQSIKKWFVNI
jgi:hypothetical protein